MILYQKKFFTINKQFNKNPNIIHLHFVANDYHQTLLIVTHGSTLAEISNRSIEMEDGRITKQFDFFGSTELID